MEKKVTFSQWQTAIREAKGLIVNQNKTRFKVVEIALRVCDTSHGGRKGEGIFSITNFANAIELSPRTLFEWMRIKRNVLDKLPKTISFHHDKIKYIDLVDVDRKLQSDASKKEVLGVFQQIQKINPEEKKWNRYNMNLRSILYNAKRPLTMGNISEEELKKTIKYCKTIHNLIINEVKFRKQFTSEKRINENKTAIEKAIAEAKIERS